MSISNLMKLVTGLFPDIVPSEFLHVMGFGIFAVGIFSLLISSSPMHVVIHPESIKAFTCSFFQLDVLRVGLISRSCTSRRRFCGIIYRLLFCLVTLVREFVPTSNLRKNPPWVCLHRLHHRSFQHLLLL